MDTLPPQVLVGLVSLGVIVLVRLRPRQVPRVRPFVGPLVVMLVGAFLLVPWLAVVTHGSLAATVGVGAIDLALTLGLGVLRGATVSVRVGESGRLESRYTAATVALWALSVVLRFALAGAAARFGASPTVTDGNILLMLGLSLLAQNMVVVRAARRLERSLRKSVVPAPVV